MNALTATLPDFSLSPFGGEGQGEGVSPPAFCLNQLARVAAPSPRPSPPKGEREIEPTTTCLVFSL